MAKKKKKGSPGFLAAKEKELQQLLGRYRVDLFFKLEPVPKWESNTQRKEKAQAIADDFFKKNTKDLSSEEKSNLVPFYKRDLDYKGVVNHKNLVLMPKILHDFLEDVLSEYKTDNYAPVLFKKGAVVDTDYSFLQDSYMNKKQENNKFINNLLASERTKQYIENKISQEELTSLKSGKIPASLRVIKIDINKPYESENLMLIKQKHFKEITRVIEIGDYSFLDKIKKEQVLLRLPYITKPPMSNLSMEVLATFSPNKLKEIGISDDQAAAIALKKRENPRTSRFFDKYVRSDNVLKKVNDTSSSIKYIDEEAVNKLIDRMLEDPRYSRQVEIVNPLSTEEAARLELQYQKVVPYFLKMCATNSVEKQKLKNMGLSDVEIMMMKHGYRFSRIYESGAKSNHEIRLNLNIHHVIPRSYGRHVKDVKTGELIYVTHDKKGNLALMPNWIHAELHKRYDSQPGKVKNIVDLTKFGNVFDPFPLLEEYKIPLKPVKDPKNNDDYSPMWKVVRQDVISNNQQKQK